jgi:hypothetical protein
MMLGIAINPVNQLSALSPPAVVSLTSIRVKLLNEVPDEYVALIFPDAGRPASVVPSHLNEFEPSAPAYPWKP